ncbi:MAG TPA: benzoate-CoA ligase family protein, partial [Terriglobia bacterium]|nr:benzoate-CoA ligase family protein [Terriglobia bacterium]
GDSTAVIAGDEQLTYREVATLVGRTANAFASGGVARGDRVLLLLLDSPAFVTAFWGAIKLGAVPVPANTLLRAEDYEFMLRDSGARGLVVDERLLGRVRPALDHLAAHPEGGKGRWGALEAVWIASEAFGGAPVGHPSSAPPEPDVHRSFDQACAGSPPDSVAAPTRRDDPAFWLYTSGSTGRPKAAVHLHHDMVDCLESYARGVLGITSSDRTFSTSKLYFAYGLGNALYFPFGVGASTVLFADRPTPDAIFEIIRRTRPTVFFSVPALYAAMLQAAESGSFDLSSVRVAVSAGESLPAPLWDRFQARFGISVLDGIGSTEMLHMFISNRPDDAIPGSSGRLVPGYEARIVDEHGHEVAPGQLGELWIRGASAARGYWNRPELSRAAFRGEWTVTGDKFVQDERGYFWHHGRTDDMLKVSGLWVSPVEIESALLGHPSVLECAVVGAADSDGLTKPKAFVVLKDAAHGPLSHEEELAAFVRTQLPGYKVPRWIVLIEALPRTATGKIQRFKLRQSAA